METIIPAIVQDQIPDPNTADNNSIPAELMACNQWVAWHLEERVDGQGKPVSAKVPLDAKTGHNAAADDPTTWSSYEQVINYMSEHEDAMGIGFVFNGNGFMGIDIDHCVNPDTGQVNEAARGIIVRLNSYTEFSQSGTGIHIIIKASLPDHKGRKETKLGIEMYDSKRYFIVTGTHISGTPSGVENRQHELDVLYAELFGHEAKETIAASPTPSVSVLADEQVIEKAMAAANGDKFKLLWKGTWQDAGYSSQSEADLALCTLLSFWSGRDKVQIDHLFKQSGLMRDKWNRSDYRETTINKAVEHSTVYSGGLPKTPGKVEFELTDYGNAERLVAEYGKNIRYCHEIGWLCWDNTRWSNDDDGAIMRLAKQTVRKIQDEANAMQIPATASDKIIKQLQLKQAILLKHAKHSESEKSLNAMIKLAQSEPGIPIKADQLDADPWLINLINGTFNLKIMEFREHRRGDLITKIAGVEYKPEATCDLWLSALTQVMDNKQELVEYIQRWCGYVLTGDVSEQSLALLYGIGGNMKSTAAETIMSVLGDYAQVAPASLITKKYNGNEGIPNDVARLKGIRLAVCSEVEEGHRWNESKLKDLTGNRVLTARFLHREYFDFPATHKLWIYGNHRPSVAGNDEGIWRRLQLVPFTVVIPKDKRDPYLAYKFQAELSGIFNWMLQGCKEWQQQGLNPPSMVVEATAEYRTDMDVLGQFIEERCQLKADGWIATSDLYLKYTVWMEDRNETPMIQKSFCQRLRDSGFKPNKKNGIRGWSGIQAVSNMFQNSKVA